MAKKLLGHCACPECGFADAEIGEDKSGNPYRYCPDCNAQYFAKADPKRRAALLKMIREAQPSPSPAPEKKPDPPAPIKKRGALDTFLYGNKT
jgi:DNA-directed RNA polymerase subunit RPC12/RpoP